MAFLTANSYLGLIAEATRGTLPGSGTPTYIPIQTPQITPMQKFLRDEALRGSPTLVYDQVQGVRHDEVEFKSYLYADTFPLLLTAILGGNDTVTGAGPYNHVIKLYNNPANGSQPKSYSLLDFDGANYFTVTGAQADTLNLTFGAEAAADATIKFFGNPYTSYTSAPAPFTSLSLSTEHMVPAWDTTISVGGTTFTYIANGELMLSRKTQPIFTMGTQAPLVNFAGPLEVTGKFTAVVNSTSDTWSTGTGATALTRSPQAVVITFTDPNDLTGGTAHSISFTMTSTQFHDVKRIRGKEYTEVEVQFTANASTTDATLGFSPIATTTVNGTSTAYQTGY
jgi:hypothetical protein